MNLQKYRALFQNRSIAVLGQHPIPWLLLFAFVVYHQVTKINYIGFNIIEALLGKSLFHGWGYAFAPLDPPALSRPILAPVLCGIIELFVTHPTDVYRCLYVFSLGSFLVSIFYLFKSIAGAKAGNLAVGLLFVTPVFTIFPWSTHHFSSHLALLSVLGWAVWATVKAWQRGAVNWFFLGGILWGGAFLARYEMVLTFGGCWVVSGIYLWGKLRRLRVIKCLGAFAFAFLLFYVPKDIYYHKSAKTYGIVADNAIYTYYTGEIHSRAGTPVPNGDNLGYIESQQIYGSVESNKGSLFYMVLKHPRPVWRRFVQNLRVGTHEVYKSRTYIIPAVLVFLLGLLHRRARPYFCYAGLFLALHLAGYINFLFHLDLRYLTPMVSSLFLLVSLGFIICVVEILPSLYSHQGLRAFGLLFLTIPLFMSFRDTAYFPKADLGARQTSEGYAEIGAFLKTLKLPTPPIVWIEIPEDLFLLQPFFSYFADNAIPWSFTGPFPLDKMAALSRKKMEYIVLDSTQLPKHPELARTTALFQVKTSVYGVLSLYEVRDL